ncbi:MAG: aminoacyl--tRNA ligase-related protein [Candidatus Adlerbacteria bacterium]|nr:aminoacyl--tRNA ligase-related protein [Candidatus Adlerbacteria bacterium]MDZ4226206.1 aminoacyl--tRNA ligase-related protein [Patescibacteria group bacterium]
MRQSQLFTKTRREAPKDEVAKNAQLLIRGGYINKEMAGVYDYLPLGLCVVEKIKAIVREEMNKIGGQEIIMSALQRKDVWEKTDRWADEKVDVWFKSELKAGGEVGFGWSHEEPITEMMMQYLSSYRDLPAYVYQFQTKLRNELRAKSGIMRGREFVMKDMYSYSKDEEAHKKFYDSAVDAYLRVFDRVGLGDRTFLTFASGGAFTKYSHEFQTLCDTGEDTIFVDKTKGIAINKEVLTDEVKKELEVGELTEARAVEVGNIFDFGGVKSTQLGLFYKNEAGKQVPVHLGSYGLGITRLMGVLVEIFSDDKGIVWPESVAPFRIHLIELSNGNGDVSSEAAELYRELTEAGVEVLWDDRDVRAGEKFADSDLVGIPLRVVVSEKTLAAGKFECVHRMSGKTEHLSTSDLLQNLTTHA